MVGEHEKDYVAVAIKYAERVVRDKKRKKFCLYTQLACKRFLNDLKTAEKQSSDWYFDEWHGNDVCDFIEKLPHVEGSWDNPCIELVAPQIFILVNVFGFRRHSDGHRRFNTVYIEMARKNAKSALSAGVALYSFCCEGEEGPQVKFAATTGDQARIVFNVCCKMIQKTPDLAEAFGLKVFKNAIVCETNSGDAKPINAKASTQDGLNPHMRVMDEVHAQNRDLFDVLRSACGARKNPLGWYITTAGYNLTGVCYDQRKFVIKVLTGVVEADHYFGIIFTIDEEDIAEERYFDPDVWGKANPLLNVSVQLEELKGYSVEAKNSPGSLSEFLTKRLNFWTASKSGFINIDKWSKCDGPIILKELRAEPCYAGLDLASTSDICALSLVWLIGERVKVYNKYYLPEDAVRPRTERGNVPYQVWADQGLLTLTPGNVADYDYIERDIRQLYTDFNIVEFAFDRWNAWQLINKLEDEYPFVEFRQGPASFNAPMREIERKYLGGKLDHGGDPILKWQASNLVSREDVNKNIAPCKKTSEEKIDNMVSTIMGLGRAMVNDTPGSVYERRGLVEL